MALKRRKGDDDITSPGVGGNDGTVKQEDPTGQATRVKKEDFGDDALTLKQRMLEHKSITKARRVYRAQRGMTVCDDDDDEIVELYGEFMALKILHGDFDVSVAKLSSGEKVDEFWRVHILDTAGYVSFFREFSPCGEVVHHDADQRQEKMREVYKQVFKKECPFFHTKGIMIAHQKQNTFSIYVIVIRGGVNCLAEKKKVRFKVDAGATTLDLKIMVEKRKGIPLNNQRLIFEDTFLEDEMDLVEYGITASSIVQVVYTKRYFEY